MKTIKEKTCCVLKLLYFGSFSSRASRFHRTIFATHQKYLTTKSKISCVYSISELVFLKNYSLKQQFFLKLTIIKLQHFNTLTLNFFCHFHFSLNYGPQFLDKPRASAHHEWNGHCFAYPEIGGQFSVISNNFAKKVKKKNENKSTCKFPNYKSNSYIF